MDEIYCALCDKFAETGTGKYSVFYEDELLEIFPENERNRDALEAALTRLSSEGCIDVKYARGSAFCLAYLKPFIPPVTEENNPEGIILPSPEMRIQDRKFTIAVFAAAFFGGAIGGGIFALIGGLI